MKVICPHCESEFYIDPSHCGEKATCTECNKPFLVPVPLGILPGVKPPYRPAELQGIASLFAIKILVYFIIFGVIATLLVIALRFVR